MDDQDADRDVAADGRGDGQPAWTPLVELSTRTGRTVEALRKAVKRQGFDLPKRRRNDGSWEVLVGPDDVRRLARGSSAAARGVDGRRDVGGDGRDVQGARPPDGQGDGPRDVQGDVRLDAELLARAAVAEALVAELREQVAALKAELHREMTGGRAERDRLLALVEQMAAERRPAGRPWPGLRAWWRRLIEGGE